MTYTRYAIYYAPPVDADWTSFATRWLGWSTERGEDLDQPDVPGLPLALSDITKTPRKYGLHATLKAPFRLAAGHGRADLETACAALAADLGPVHLNGLTLSRLGRFLALTPVGPTGALNAMAARCVCDLDRFRAPLTQADLARRRASGLSPAQDRNLIQWGYPHVLDLYRFHITLSGRLENPVLSQVETVLNATLTPLLPAPLILSDIALMGEDGDGKFHLLRRFDLTGPREIN